MTDNEKRLPPWLTGQKVPMTAAEKTKILAERVMGWRVHYQDTRLYVSPELQKDGRRLLKVVGYTREWDPLTNLSHAGEVLEAMRAKGWDYLASTCPTSKRHWVEFIPPHHAKENHGKLYAYANKLSTAICHAALLAHGVQEEEL